MSVLCVAVVSEHVLQHRESERVLHSRTECHPENVLRANCKSRLISCLNEFLLDED